jgi:pimeloyl-ACP methyl ester carboxylesterase
VPAGAVRLPAVRLPGPSAVRNLTGAVSVATRTAVGLVSPRAAPAAARIHDPLPPGLMIPVPGVGELFVRDTHPQGGGRLGTVLLLHGWLMASDINWWLVYQPLRRAGWRVIALDARGHGRGLRPEGPFRIADCARMPRPSSTSSPRGGSWWWGTRWAAPSPRCWPGATPSC